MFVLVTGGSASGKSEYAENRLLALRGQRRNSVYIATMEPFGQEAQERIRKHREQRKQKSFETVECYTDLHTCIEGLENKELFHGDILLECMSNLVANEMFRDTDIPSEKERKIEAVCEKILFGVDSLLSQCRNLVIVTNEVFGDTMTYEKETQKSRRGSRGGIWHTTYLVRESLNGDVLKRKGVME